MTENNTPEHTLLHFRQIKVAPTSHSRHFKKRFKKNISKTRACSATRRIWRKNTAGRLQRRRAGRAAADPVPACRSLGLNWTPKHTGIQVTYTHGYTGHPHTRVYRSPTHTQTHLRQHSTLSAPSGSEPLRKTGSGKCGTYRGGERCIHSFGEKPCGKETTWKTHA